MASHANAAAVATTVAVKSAVVASPSDSRNVAAVVDSPQAADSRIAPLHDVPSQCYRKSRDLKSRTVLDLVPGPSFDLVVAAACPVPLATASVARVAVALNDEVASLEGAEVSASGMLDLDCHLLCADLVTGLDEDGAGEAFEHWSEQRCPALPLADSATLLSPANNLSRNSAFA